MPKWLKKELMRAYSEKDIYRIRFLNDSWFVYAKG